MDKNLKDFASIPSDFRVEAAREDRERLDTDLKAIGQTQEIIKAVYPGCAKYHRRKFRYTSVLKGVECNCRERITLWCTASEHSSAEKFSKK